MSRRKEMEQCLRLKSLFLTQRSIDALSQIDTHQFPSDTSEYARKLLLDNLQALLSPDISNTASAYSLFRSAIQIRTLIESVELSHIGRVSWPIVQYCDKLWQRIFPSPPPRIFYSTTPRHNYQISSFSRELEKHLHDVLPNAVGQEILKSRLYCLHLSSVEDGALPLYANIGHEFGHAVYSEDSAIRPLVWNFLSQCLDRIFPIPSSSPEPTLPGLSRSRAETAIRHHAIEIFHHLAKEIFADLFAAFLFGPSYCLSLSEMSWGVSDSEWLVYLSPRTEEIRAYPSFHFRLNLIKRFSNAGHLGNLLDLLAQSKSKVLKELSHVLPHFPIWGSETPDSEECVKILGKQLSDAANIEPFLNTQLQQIQEALKAFAEQCCDLLQEKYGNIHNRVDAAKTYELIERLNAGIPPNIVPDDSLLGVPAEFENILFASGLWRLLGLLQPGEFMGDSKADSLKQIKEELEKIERLTSKALEVTYVQREFKEAKF